MWDIIGQERAVFLFQRSLERGSLAHAYLLVGPPHIGKMTLALNIAQALNCESSEPPCGKCTVCKRIASVKHSDVQVLELSRVAESDEGESKTKIGVEQVDQILHSVNLAPFEGRYRVFIIDGVEYMSIAAANRLLKTIEEPVGKVVFILLTANESLVPATVVSRCQRIELLSVSNEEIEEALSNRWQIEPQKAKLLVRLSNGCFGWVVSAIADDSLIQQRTEWLDGWREMFDADFDRRFAFAAKMVEKYSQNREVVQQKLDLLLSWWRDLLLVKVDCGKDVTSVDFEDALKEMAIGYSLSQIRAFVGRIQSAKEQLRLNANPQLVVEVLMLNIPEKSKVENPIA
ncbi:MAG: AAA family ATPase [Chloroflexi bacterium]|nr:AAA family ATPase [Chloroflexota bacterium]